MAKKFYIVNCVKEIQVAFPAEAESEEAAESLARNSVDFSEYSSEWTFYPEEWTFYPEECSEDEFKSMTCED